MPQQSPHPSGRVVSVRLDPDTEARLNALAERTGRSRGVYIRLALQAALPQLEREHWNQLMSQWQEDRFEAMFRDITAHLIDEENF